MDDVVMNQTTQQPVTPPVVPTPITSDPVVAAPVAPVAPPSVDDLQKITQDLQNLVQEVTTAPAGAPVTTPPAAPVPTVVPAPMPTPVVSAPAPAEATVPSQMKATVYVISDCPYCKTEKEFLTNKNIAFVEKNVETDEASLKEMLTLSDNFAGVPVTVLEGKDGKKVVVKGFTQADFEEEMKKIGLDQTTDNKQPASQRGEQTTADAQPATPAAPAPMPQIPDLN